MSLLARDIWSQTPPSIRTRDQDNPTLLVSWWATGFSFVIILLRICGRYIRVERFFLDDLIMLVSLVPLFTRMAFVHVVLLWGTNNTKTAGLTPLEISHREIGSKLVLASRIFYAIFIWTAKLSVCEFLARLSGMIWKRSIQIFLHFIRYFLAATLVAVIISTLAECHPFSHYWQVVPDPGMLCRAGYANLVTMGACDVITDILLVVFPVPIIIMANMGLKRKVFLVVLFAASLILVAIALYRVPAVISRHGSQQYRSLFASLEILAASATSNTLVIGSLIRDKGVKKRKFKKVLASTTAGESVDQSSFRRATITHHQWGSDSDLAADVGIRLRPELYSGSNGLPRSAPPAAPYNALTAGTDAWDPNWTMKRYSMGSDESKLSMADSVDIKISPHEYIETSKTPRKKSEDATMSPSRKVSFMDPAGLLELDCDTQSPNKATQEPATSAGSHVNSNRICSPVSPNFSRPGGMPRRKSSNCRRGSAYSAGPLHSTSLYRSSRRLSAPIAESEDMELQDVGEFLSKHMDD